MADFLLRDIGEDVVERIKALARQRGWPLNDVILHLIKQALGLSEPEPPPVPGDIARLMGAWNETEMRAFNEAMSAFSGLPDDEPNYLEESPKTKPPGKP